MLISWKYPPPLLSNNIEATKTCKLLLHVCSFIARYLDQLEICVAPEATGVEGEAGVSSDHTLPGKRGERGEQKQIQTKRQKIGLSREQGRVYKAANRARRQEVARLCVLTEGFFLF